MPKYRPYSRDVLRALFRQWFRENRRRVMGIVVGALVLMVIESLLLGVGWHATPQRPYLLGFTHAAIIAATVHIIYLSFLTHERKAIWHVRGAWGEENTRDVLRRARRKRIIWGWVDSIALQIGDIDHLVITRNGGLIAIDSKWRSSDMKDHDDMTRSAARVRRRSQGLAESLLRAERGSHRARRSAFDVQPAVVLWGSAQNSVPPNAQIDGIRFIAGSDLITWLGGLSGDPIDEDAATDLIQRLEGFRDSASRKSSVNRD